MAKLVSQNAVSVLPPTISIKDPATRSFLDSLANILDARSGYTDRDAPERFITAAEFQGLATRAIARAFGGNGAAIDSSNGKIPSALEINDSIDNLSDFIKRTIIYQALGEQFSLIDIEGVRKSIAALVQRSDEALDRAREIIADMENGFTEEREARTTADESLTTSITAAVSRLGAAEAAIVTEQTTRATADSAITTSLDVAVSRIGSAEAALTTERETRAGADAALTSSLSTAVSRLDGAEAAIVAEQTTRASADAALTTSLNAATSRIGAAESAIVTEQSTRATKDMSLASAINTIWSEVGGAGSVIQDGSLASSTPNSTQATKWRQVQSAVTDPNTGLVASAAMREDFTTYASNVDGRFNSLYSVRAQLSTGGIVLSGLAKTGPTASLAGSTVLRLSANAPVGTVPGMYAYGTGLDGVTTVVGISGAEVTLSGPLGLDAAGAYTFTTNKMLVGGFGLAATGDSGSGQGGTIDFGVRADRFFIAATSETPDAATQIAQGSSIPFMVLTSPQAVNGVVYQPGVYLKKAVIGNATIGEAQIADLAVTNAKIGETIQSNNYVQGSSGWSINKSGYAEFDLVRMRRREVLATGLLDPISIGEAGMIRMIDTIFVEYGKVGGVMRVVKTFVEVSLPPIPTGVTDSAIRNAYAYQPYGVGVWQEGFGALRNWADGSPGTPDSISLAFSGDACTATTYSNSGSWADNNMVHVSIRVVARAITGGGDFTIPPLRWVLYRM